MKCTFANATNAADLAKQINELIEMDGSKVKVEEVQTHATKGENGEGIEFTAFIFFTPITAK